MRKSVLIIACFIICMSFISCKKDNVSSVPVSDTVVGRWSAKIDMTDTVNQMVYYQIGAETVAFDFPMTLILSIQSDGTYRVEVDRAELDVQLDRLGDVFWQTVVDQAKAQSHLSSNEAIQALQAQGKTKEVLMQQLDLVSLFENSYAESGVWKEDNGVLCFAQNEEMLMSAEGYPYSLDDLLSVTYTELNENQEATQKVVVFTRVK